MTDRLKITRALISVSDKTGLAELGQALAGRGIEILSTGGTAKALAAAGVPVIEVAEVTGFPEMLDGRVKTLHPKIHGGLLGRRDKASHRTEMQAHGIAPIDLIVVNLYPFAATIARGADFDDCIENIDIGGPAMIRSAAKNHAFVAVVTDPKDYPALIEAMAGDGSTSGDFRRRLAAKAFQHTGAYDSAIGNWFASVNGTDWPPHLVLDAALQQSLSYGENPHQKAALYLTGEKRPGAASAGLLQGKALSYNNLNDADAAFELVTDLAEKDMAAVAIIKHANPCGVAVAPRAIDAYRKALQCDPVSAFGGVIALNVPLDAETAQGITEIFTEVIIAPAVTDEARQLIAKKKNLRLLITGAMPKASRTQPAIRSIAGGYLVQSYDDLTVNRDALRTVTRREPNVDERTDMIFAFTVAKHVKSNAIVYVRNGATLGIGAGQMSRVDSSRIAAEKASGAGLSLNNSVVASDAFFPFADGLEAAIAAGARAVIQPGGSIRDEEVIAAADRAELAMVFTGIRHFRH